MGIPAGTSIPAAIGVNYVFLLSLMRLSTQQMLSVFSQLLLVFRVVVVSAITGVSGVHTFARNPSFEGVFIVAGIPVFLLLLASLLLLAPLLLMESLLLMTYFC